MKTNPRYACQFCHKPMHKSRRKDEGDLILCGKCEPQPGRLEYYPRGPLDAFEDAQETGNRRRDHEVRFGDGE